MTKKEYILAVIDTFPDWEMGRWIKAMVQNNQLDERTMNMLVIILNNAMDKITTAVKESKLIEKIDARKNLNEQKEKQAKKDEKTLQELDSKLNDI